MLGCGYCPWLITFMSGIWWHITLISNVRYQKKRNESDIKMDFQNLVLFMMIGTKSSRSWGLLRNIFAIFINLSIFVWEYRTRRPVIPHVNERYVTKPQTSHNTMQKTRPRYLNLERFYWGSVFARKKKHSVFWNLPVRFEKYPYFTSKHILFYSAIQSVFFRHAKTDPQ